MSEGSYAAPGDVGAPIPFLRFLAHVLIRPPLPGECRHVRFATREVIGGSRHVSLSPARVVPCVCWATSYAAMWVLLRRHLYCARCESYGHTMAAHTYTPTVHKPTPKSGPDADVVAVMVGAVRQVTGVPAPPRVKPQPRKVHVGAADRGLTVPADRRYEFRDVSVRDIVKELMIREFPREHELAPIRRAVCRYGPGAQAARLELARFSEDEIERVSRRYYTFLRDFQALIGRDGDAPRGPARKVPKYKREARPPVRATLTKLPDGRAYVTVRGKAYSVDAYLRKFAS